MAAARPPFDWIEDALSLIAGGGSRRRGTSAEVRHRAAVLEAYALAILDDEGVTTSGPFAGMHAGRQARALVPHLASALVLHGCDRPSVSADGGELVAGYLAALVDASSAVALCRRTEHPAGSCWFSKSGPSADICGQVLEVAHLVSMPALLHATR